ncbi:DNA repair protein RAD51 4 [Hypsizygus marmoreus]|uniref:DNA repair protein RAD51 4 n=1 Tax=Hypsizygus marmoreus TaxID=39966 RepID=A0A369KBN2_HYPMA|nr:DNA repair protein RAD51 4 [Hypsizygus marmoreus]
MRLATLVPSVPAGLVDCLEKCGIRTDTDLLFTPTLDLYRQLPSGTITLRELGKTIARVADLASAKGTSGVDMLKEEVDAQSKSRQLSSGVSELDQLLNGFGGQHVFEICGDRQSGKTVLALNVVLRHLSQSENTKVLWMDTTGDFSVDEASRILNCYITESASGTALERLQVSSTFDIEAAYEYSANTDTRKEAKLSCIVIDAITPLLGPLLSAVSAQGHSMMTGFMHQLRIFAQTYSCSILVINNTTFFNPSNPYSALANAASTRKPALGPSFAFLTDATLWLTKAGEQDEADPKIRYTIHTAEVLRSKITRSKTWCTFKIAQGKVLDYAPDQ